MLERDSTDLARAMTKVAPSTAMRIQPLRFIDQVVDDLETAMPEPANLSMFSRLLETARPKVATAMALLGQPTPDVARQVAVDLHLLAGEAALLDQADLARTAQEGEEAARALASGNKEAIVPCMRTLRQLEYILKNASDQADIHPPSVAYARVCDPRRILIVDDSDLSSLALADVFEMHNFEVRVASTMSRARALFSSFKPSVLISDVHMPDLDVVSLCRAFRSTSSHGRRTSVVLVSGRTEAELRERLSEIKPDAFVSKLAGTEAVVACITHLRPDLCE